MPNRRRYQLATDVQRRINQMTGVSRARTQAARSATTGQRSARTLQAAVNARMSRNLNARGEPVISRRTGEQVGTMVKRAG